jgi:hypothetical protein
MHIASASHRSVTGDLAEKIFMSELLTNGNFCMKAIVSLLVLSCALIIVFNSGKSKIEKHWAFGVIGIIVGYWLHNS